MGTFRRHALRLICDRGKPGGFARWWYTRQRCPFGLGSDFFAVVRFVTLSCAVPFSCVQEERGCLCAFGLVSLRLFHRTFEQNAMSVPIFLKSQEERVSGSISASKSANVFKFNKNANMFKFIGVLVHIHLFKMFVCLSVRPSVRPFLDRTGLSSSNSFASSSIFRPCYHTGPDDATIVLIVHSSSRGGAARACC